MNIKLYHSFIVPHLTFYSIVEVAVFLMSTDTLRKIMGFLMTSVHRPYNWEQPVVSELPATDQLPNLVDARLLTTSGAQPIAQLLLVAHVLFCCYWFHSVAHINVDVRIIATRSN